MIPYRRDLKTIARSLRANMTDSEQALWTRLRGKQLKGVQFYRQRPIGNSIVDFYAPKAKLVVEVDGSQHFTSENIKKDEIRPTELEKQGLRILRFNNLEVLQQIDAVIEVIFEALPEPRKIPPSPPLAKGG